MNIDNILFDDCNKDPDTIPIVLTLDKGELMMVKSLIRSGLVTSISTAGSGSYDKEHGGIVPLQVDKNYRIRITYERAAPDRYTIDGEIQWIEDVVLLGKIYPAWFEDNIAKNFRTDFCFVITMDLYGNLNYEQLIVRIPNEN